MRLVYQSVRRFFVEDSGHALVEYLFMMMLVIFACLAGIAAVGDQTHNLFKAARDAMP